MYENAGLFENPAFHIVRMFFMAVLLSAAVGVMSMLGRNLPESGGRFLSKRRRIKQTCH
jgi:hypothetical protein